MREGRDASGSTLAVAPETGLLPEVPLDALKAGPPAPGGWARTRIGGRLEPEALMTKVAGKVGGGPLPEWADGSDGAQRGQTLVFRAADVILVPAFGVLIDAGGHVLQSTAGESLSWNPDLAVLPSVRRAGEARVFDPPADLPRIDAATVFMAKGGEFNYGHYLLDCLSTLLAVEEQGLTAAAPPLAPPLNRWHRELLGLAFPDLGVRETRAPLVRLGEAVFASNLDHFLHRPNRILLDLRERILARSPPPTSARRIYVSRRAYPMRVMVDEPALERALRARGFEIVRAERLGVADQIALFRGAEVIVGATGAGLANALFAPEGAKVFEILPATFANWWLRNLVHLAGGDWHGYFCAAPTDPREVSWRYRIRRGFRWGYRLPVGDFLGFLDERM